MMDRWGHRKLQSSLNTLNPRDLRPIGEAMVMYNYEAHANNCFRDHPSSDVEMMANLMRCRRSGAELNGKSVLVRGLRLGWGWGLGLGVGARFRFSVWKTRAPGVSCAELVQRMTSCDGASEETREEMLCLPRFGYGNPTLGVRSR